MSSWRFKIGDIVSILSHKDRDGSLCLADPENKDELSNYSEDSFLVIGRHQRFGYLALLVDTDFDPYNYLCDRVDDYMIKSYDIAEKYRYKKVLTVGQDYVYISSNTKEVVNQIHMNEPGGCYCNICQKFCQYAGPNLPNGGMVCYSCRTTKRWKLDTYLQSVGLNPSSVRF